MTGPHNKPVMDDRRLRETMVHVFGAESAEVAQLDDLLHRLWAAEEDN